MKKNNNIIIETLNYIFKELQKDNANITIYKNQSHYF